MFSLTDRPIRILAPSGGPALFAAEQLAYYLAIITGNRFSVVEMPGPGEISLRSDSFGRDARPGAFRVVVNAGGVKLYGDSHLALLHAAYYFLEKHCGCRWLSEWDGGEIIPRNTELAIPFGDETVSPAFTNRAFTNFPDINRDSVTMLDWMVKNRFNRFMVFANVDTAFADYRKYLREEAILRGVKMEMGHHSFKFWLPPAEFFAEHPEWYALVSGERSPEAQLCTSNPQVAEVIAERIAAFFEDNFEFDRVGLWPNDGFGWCECEACQALEPQAECALYAGQPRRTDTYVRFVNAVAERLDETHPERSLSALAYVNYVEPPTIPVARNVDVCFAPMNRCFKHPFNGEAAPECRARACTAPDDAGGLGGAQVPALQHGDPECTRANARYAEFFAGWREAVRGELYLFEYTMLIDMCSLPFRLTDMYPPNWAWLAEHGCDGFVMEYKPEEWGTYGLNGYLLGRYAWEPNLDLPAFLQEHYAELCGPAAEEMAAFFEAYMRDFVRPGPCVYHYDLSYTQRATEALLEPALAHLGRARLRAAKGEKRHWQAVEKTRVGVELLIRFGEWQRAWRDANLAPEGTGKRAVLLRDAREAGERLIRFAGEHSKSGALYAPRIEQIVRSVMGEE